MQRISDQQEFDLLCSIVDNPPAGESSLHAFVRHFWGEVDPHRFTDGWHLHAKCEVLEDVAYGRIKDLVINEPPASCKSMLCNVLFPAWLWLKVDPKSRMMFASFDQALINRDALKFLGLLKSRKVRGAFPKFSLGPENEQKAIQAFYNDHGGLRYGTTPGGTLTGWHFNGHIYDDLIKPASINEGIGLENQKALSKAINWLRTTAANRAVDVNQLWRVIIAQRLHENDPTGEVLADEGWEHLCLPEEYVPKARWIVGDLTAKKDPRTKPGALLWPERRDAKAVQKLKDSIKNPAQISAQMQQNPTPAEGGILSEKRFKAYAYRERPDLAKCQCVASWDLSFKGEQAEQSRVVGQLWAHSLEALGDSGEMEHRYYLIDACSGHLDFSGAKSLVKSKMFDPLWKRAGVHLVEDKANGPALLSDLKGTFRKLQEYEPGNKDKVARMLPFLDDCKNGTVVLPCPDVFLWSEEFIQEIVKVPRGAYDDHFDAMSQALAYMKTGMTNYSQALKKLRARRRRG